MMKEDYAATYEKLYNEHFWWRSREKVVWQAVSKDRTPGSEELRVLDIGCGNGLFFPKLEQLGQVEGIEVDTTLLTEGPYRKQISTELLGHSIYEGKQYDIITCLDVLEHIEDDHHAIQCIDKLLAPGGRFVATVPAFMLLWDEHDEINRHFRRYNKKQFVELVSPLGSVERAQYLFHTVGTIKLGIGTMNRFRKRTIAQHQMPSRLMNKLMYTTCRAEYQLFNWLRFPFGSSVLAVVEKPLS